MGEQQSIIGRLLLLVILILGTVLGVDLVTELGIDPNLLNPGEVTPTLPANQGPQENTFLDRTQIYFTDPSCPPIEERQGGLDELVAEDILKTRKRVDVAAYDLDSEAITGALIALEEQGIPVRVVTDDDNGDNSDVRRLRRHGISVVEDKRRGLMHDKFVIIDEQIVWTGSMNLTSNGVYCNNNNFVRFNISRLAANYTAEMDEMYEKREFGPDSPVNIPSEIIYVDGVRVENYFASETQLSPVVARTVARAQKELLILAFSFTDRLIGEALLGRVDAGVPTRGVFETTGSETDSAYFVRMLSMHVPNLEVRQDENSRLMHHKVIIVDRETVLLGSFNFTDSANRRNDENIVIVHDPEFAHQFVQEFEKIWAVAGG